MPDVHALCRERIEPHYHKRQQSHSRGNECHKHPQTGNSAIRLHYIHRLHTFGTLNKKELLDNLNDCILPYWMNKMVDPRGGFYGRRDGYDRLDADAPKGGG